MAEEERTYQPNWGDEKKHHHHHHHYERNQGRYSNSWGGGTKMRDRQAYIGLMLVVGIAVFIGAFKIVMMFVHELRAMPHDDPNTELNVDALRVRKVDEQDAIQFGDSLAQAEGVDSIRRTVQIDSRPVYRPPRRESKWYITKREWKAIWNDFKIWQWERKREKEQKNEEKK